MSIDILSKDILLKAQKEKESIKTEMSREMSFAEENFNLELDVFKKKEFSKHQDEILQQKEKILGYYKRESKRVVLEVKSKLISEIYAEVSNYLDNLKGSERVEFLQQRIKSVYDFDYDSFRCSQKDLKFFNDIFPTNIQALVDDNVDGIVFEAKGGKEIFDMGFKAVLKEVFENSEEEIQRILFDI